MAGKQGDQQRRSLERIPHLEDRSATPGPVLVAQTKETPVKQMLTGPSVIALEVGGGVDGPVLDHDFKVKMAAGGVAGRSDTGYPATFAQGLAL